MKNKAKAPAKTKSARKPPKRTCIGAPPAPRNPVLPETVTTNYPTFGSGHVALSAPTGLVLHVESVHRTSKIELHFDTGSKGAVVVNQYAGAVAYFDRNDLIALLECFEKLGEKIDDLTGGEDEQ